MKFDIDQVGGIGKYCEEKKMVGEGIGAEEVTVYRVAEQEDNRAFLIVRRNTFEVRTDKKLRDLLRERYESVMESRYFGRAGIEIVNTGQIGDDEINDLVRLSYQLSQQR